MVVGTKRDPCTNFYYLPSVLGWIYGHRPGALEKGGSPVYSGITFSHFNDEAKRGE